ncbi:alpha/beta fold hydrolase [Streptomyces sp. ODS05-4]|uniref:alpha/beta fold hydrolase n=1 Tax=Streptomyces sp. ODS05-4 TaxID=2944939 RepID=UPI00210C5CB8|nr:alpha/beta hydrolase [Streptomyces sp. ODS05-4]
MSPNRVLLAGMAGMAGVTLAAVLPLMTMVAMGPRTSAAASSEQSAAPAEEFSGQVDVGGGRKLYLHCKGSGSPVVLLESGIHDSSDTWTITDTKPPVPSKPSVFDGVAAFTRVCAYDRPGTVRYGQTPSITRRSTPIGRTRSLSEMSDDVDRMLEAAGVPGPYVLTGHSFGGMIQRLYAQRHPDNVAGLVFVDAFDVSVEPLMGGHWPAYVKLLNAPGTTSDDDEDFEKVDVEGALAAVRQAPPLPRVPAAVLSKSQPFAVAPTAPEDVLKRLEASWPKVQDALVDLEPQTPHTIATGSDHYIQINDPDLTTSMIRLVHGRADRD